MAPVYNWAKHRLAYFKKSLADRVINNQLISGEDVAWRWISMFENYDMCGKQCRPHECTHSPTQRHLCWHTHETDRQKMNGWRCTTVNLREKGFLFYLRGRKTAWRWQKQHPDLLTSQRLNQVQHKPFTDNWRVPEWHISPLLNLQRYNISAMMAGW